MTAHLILLLVIVFLFTVIEAKHRLKPSSPLQIKAKNWEITKDRNELKVIGLLEISNPHKRMEVMVPTLKVRPTLLGLKMSNELSVKTELVANHPDEEERKDDYWAAYIVKSRKSTIVRVRTTIRTSDPSKNLDLPQGIWIDVDWTNYGPFGRLRLREGFVVSIKKQVPINLSEVRVIESDNYKLIPIKTHLLGTLDETLEVLHYYASGLMQDGDIITIGETPLAVMQGRYQHPINIKPGITAKLFCRAFHPTSSLATACGLQCLINQVGPTRVIVSSLIGTFMKLIGIKGMFYRLAGKQARLIDDITGTTPPYDQTIVLGPINPEMICKEAFKALGVNIAIVDVNDLGRVKIVASSPNCDEKILLRALRSNPAGNANEQTPIVLVRPNP